MQFYAATPSEGDPGNVYYDVAQIERVSNVGGRLAAVFWLDRIDPGRRVGIVGRAVQTGSFGR